MAQNIPSLLQTAQQQYSQGTATPITAPTDSTEDNTSMGLAKAMVGKGAMAQKLARERTAENKDRFQTMFADSGVGFQGLLNTLAIGLGDKIAKPSGDGAVDAEMEAAIAGDTALTTIQKGILTAETREDFAFLKQVAAANEKTIAMVPTINALEEGAIDKENKQRAKDFLAENPSGYSIREIKNDKGVILNRIITMVDEEGLLTQVTAGSEDAMKELLNQIISAQGLTGGSTGGSTSGSTDSNVFGTVTLTPEAQELLASQSEPAK